MTFFETSNLAGAALAIRNGNTPWTAEREMRVRQLWKAGWSAGEISLDLGNTTRNAVIGKLARLGLMKGDRTPGVTLKCSPGARVAGAKVQRRPDGFRRKALPKEPGVTAPAPGPAHLVERTAAACTIAELSQGDRKCRFPFGEPSAPDFAYCGLPTKDPCFGVYCSDHSRIAYRRPA